MNGENEPPVSRRQLYPYTLTAKIVQFPNKLYWQQSWLFKYWVIGTLISLPIFYKIQRMSYAPENVKKWDEIRRKQSSGEHH